MLSDMIRLFFRPAGLRRETLPWRAWFRAVPSLRPAGARATTFPWLTVVRAALCLRPERAGVPSRVRALGLSDASYLCLLHFFHSPALDWDPLTRPWRATLQRWFARCLVRVNGRPVALADGLKRPKEGRKMPAVKSLHQESRCHAKASFLRGHSLPAVALPVHAAGACFAGPVAARIHEGLIWNRARHRRTLLEKRADRLWGLQWEGPLTVVADAYYAAAQFARSLPGAKSSPGQPRPFPRRGLLPARPMPAPPTPRPPPNLRSQNQTPLLVRLGAAVCPSPQSGVWGIRRHPALLPPGLALASAGAVGPLRLGHAPPPAEI